VKRRSSPSLAATAFSGELLEALASKAAPLGERAKLVRR
jgi:hypothetical protein